MTKVGASKTTNMKIEIRRDECITEDDINKTKDNRAENQDRDRRKIPSRPEFKITDRRVGAA